MRTVLSLMNPRSSDIVPHLKSPLPGLIDLISVLGAAVFALTPLPLFAQQSSDAAQGSDEEISLGPTTRLPQIVGAQYTFILQNQSSLESPYRGRLSLDPTGDTQPTNTVGLYLGWLP